MHSNVHWDTEPTHARRGGLPEFSTQRATHPTAANYYTLADGQSILEELEVFAVWAEEVYLNRPPA